MHLGKRPGPGNATPEELILDLYNLGIEACDKKDEGKVRKIINGLIDALDFDYKEIATSFHNLYQYALNLLETRQFDEIRNLLSELRDTWKQVIPATDGTSQSILN